MLRSRGRMFYTIAREDREGVVMRGPHGVCDCDILRRANVKADLYLLRGGGGGSSEPSEPPLGTAMLSDSHTATKCRI